MTDRAGMEDLTVPATSSWSTHHGAETARRRDADAPRSRVLLVDLPEVRVRRARDLVELIGSGVGIAVAWA